MKTALVFLADGFEEVEALTPVDYLRRSHEVEVFTVAVPSETMNDKYIVTSSHKIPVIADLSFEEFTADFLEETPDLLFFPGGMPGSVNLAKNEVLTKYIADCSQKGSHVAAICAAPAVVLAKTGILSGKEWTCYPEMEKDVEKFANGTDVSVTLAGSKHRTDLPFVTCKNVTTSRGAGTAEQFAMELVRILCGEDIAQKLKQATVQR